MSTQAMKEQSAKWTRISALKYPDVKTWTLAGETSIASKLTQENAERLAACWNATLNMPDPPAEIARLRALVEQAINLSDDEDPAHVAFRQKARAALAL